MQLTVPIFRNKKYYFDGDFFYNKLSTKEGRNKK